MKFHNITKNDMLNGDGLRVVLWVAGCVHQCEGCQNSITWNPDYGIEFDENALIEIIEQLKESHIDGITFSGGDPVHPANLPTVTKIAKMVKDEFPDKTIWFYTGSTWEELLLNENVQELLSYADVVVEGRFVKELLDVSLPWRGSSNQRVIEVQKSLKTNKIVLHCH